MHLHFDTYWSVEYQHSLRTDQQVSVDAGDGTEYLDNGSWCRPFQTNSELDLGDDAVTDIQTAVDASQGWFGLGFKLDNEFNCK